MKSLLSRIRMMPSMAVEAGAFVALDIDGRQVRIVHAEHRGATTKVQSIKSLDVPAEVDVSDPEALGAWVGSSMREGDRRAANAVMCVSRGQAVLKPLTVPAGGSEGELASMVLFQAEKELTFRAEEGVIDFSLESHYDVDAPSSEAGGVGVLVAATRRPVVEFFAKFAAAAGLRLTQLSLRPYANAVCVAACNPSADAPTCTAFVLVGVDETEIDVLVDGTVAFSRASNIKVAEMLAGPAPTTPAASSALAAAVSPDDPADAVVNEAFRNIRSYQALHADRRITSVYIAGGTGVETRVAEALRQRMNLPVAVFNPGEKLGVDPRHASAAVPALGLALGYRKPDRLPFNFISPRRPPVQRNTQRTRLITRAALAACVLLLALVLGFLHRRSAEARVTELTARYNDLKKENDRINKLAKRVKAMDAWLASSRNWVDQWALLTATFPQATDAYITGFRVSTDDAVSFTVRARSAEVITDMGRHFTAAGYEYKPGAVTTHEDPLGYVFMSEVRLVLTPKIKIDLAKLVAPPRPADDASGDPAVKIQPAGSNPPPPQPGAGGGGPGRGEKNFWRRKKDGNGG